MQFSHFRCKPKNMTSGIKNLPAEHEVDILNAGDEVIVKQEYHKFLVIKLLEYVYFVHVLLYFLLHYQLLLLIKQLE